MTETLFWLTAAAILHHHVIYPLGLAVLRPQLADPEARDLPKVTLIVPAFQEARIIAAKIGNLGELDYPAGRLSIRIECDGCTDGTADAAESAARPLRARGIDIRVAGHHENRGKIALLNAAIADADSPIIALSDASALLTPNALKQLAAHFSDPRIGFAGGVYDCETNGSASEKRYWRMQNRLRLGEAALGAPMGMSGAFYMFRKALWQPMPAATINDDFVLPMRIAAKGYRGVLDPDVRITESERTRPGQEFARRKRIGAGNLQQALICARLADPRRPGLAYAFLSGKALRAFMPFILIANFVAAAFMSASGTLYMAALACWALLLAMAFAGIASGQAAKPAWQALPLAFVTGHLANGIGALRYAGRSLGIEAGWKGNGGPASFVAPEVALAKRLFDLAAGSVLFAGFLAALPFVALAIKIDSKGPVFYRQLRVGRCLPDRTDLFWLIKFRTMRTDAEKAGAAWATKKDSRITRIGNFLRKTRLDELPQAINVLRGEMSMVGPRPERPSFFRKLEDNIPLYSERTFSVLPGITGLAQVRQGYDETIEDVRSKVGWDHAYAMQLGSLKSWLKADLSIALETALVMVRGRGQ